MSSFSKFNATEYKPADLTFEHKQNVTKAEFEKSGHFSDNNDFKIDPQVANQMGLSDARSRETKRVFDAEVLKYVQSIKDDAYKEAYKLGREDGVQKAKEEALSLAQEEIRNSLKSLTNLLQSLDNHRQKMYADNEAEIVRFCYFLAEKIIFKEVQQNKEYVAEIIKKMVPSEETSSVRISKADYAFIESHKDLLDADLNLEAVKFEEDENLIDGDVIVDTENGTLDGKLSTRLDKLKRAIEQLE